MNTPTTDAGRALLERETGNLDDADPREEWVGDRWAWLSGLREGILAIEKEAAEKALRDYRYHYDADRQTAREALRTLSDLYYEDALTAGRARRAIDTIEAALAAPAVTETADNACIGDPSHQYHSHDDDPDPAAPAVTETGDHDFEPMRGIDDPVCSRCLRAHPAVTETARRVIAAVEGLDVYWCEPNDTGFAHVRTADVLAAIERIRKEASDD